MDREYPSAKFTTGVRIAASGPTPSHPQAEGCAIPGNIPRQTRSWARDSGIHRPADARANPSECEKKNVCGGFILAVVTALSSYAKTA